MIDGDVLMAHDEHTLVWLGLQHDICKMQGWAGLATVSGRQAAIHVQHLAGQQSWAQLGVRSSSSRLTRLST